MNLRERTPRPSFPVLALLAGIGAEAIYLLAATGPLSILANGSKLTDLGGLTDHGPLAAALVTLGIIALFGLYGLALWAFARWERFGLALALGGALAFSATLVFLYPATAMDVYNYAVQGHIVTFNHLNPLVNSPSQASGDAFVAYAGSWSESTSPYGPFWIGLSSLDALIAGNNVVLAIVLLKALAAMAVVTTSALLAVAAGPRGPRAATLAAAAFGWNPLVLIELVGNGHNDSVMTALLVLAMLLLARRHFASGMAALSASIFVKYLTITAVPFYLLDEIADRARPLEARLAAIGRSCIVLAVATAVAFAPFWAGLDTLARVRQVDNNYLASIPALAILLDGAALPWMMIAQIVVVGGVALWQAVSLWRGRATPERAIFEVSFAVILVATHFAGWYLPLLVAVAVFVGDRWLLARAVVFSFTAALTIPIWAFAYPWTQPALGLLAFHEIVVPLTFVPPLAVILIRILRSDRAAPPGPPATIGASQDERREEELVLAG
jgi:hypothetical protein